MSFSSNHRRLDFLSWVDASEAASQEGSTLVWPFGAIEQHGPHLPLITDTFFAEKILIEVLKKISPELPVWRIPSQAIGFSPEHASFPGTISLSAGVMLQLVSEIGIQIAEMGFKRLIFFNAHGGQIGLLQTLARELRSKCSSMAVLPCFLWSGVDALKDLIPHSEVEEGLHAGLAETSLMLNLFPELVGIERPIDGIQDKVSMRNISVPKGWSLEGAAPSAWLTKELSSSGVIGDSTDSNSALGKALESALVDHWANLFSRLLESKWPPTN